MAKTVEIYMTQFIDFLIKYEIIFKIHKLISLFSYKLTKQIFGISIIFDSWIVIRRILAIFYILFSFIYIF